MKATHNESNKISEKLKSRSEIIFKILYFGGFLQEHTGTSNVAKLYLCWFGNLRSVVNALYTMYVSFPDDLETVISTFIPLLASIMACTKMLIFYVNRNEYGKIIKIVKDKYWLNGKTINEENIIQKYVDISISCTKFITFLLHGCPLLWVLMPIFDIVIQAFTKEAGQSVTLKLPLIPLWFIEIDTSKHPIYELEYLLQIISCLCTGHGLLSTASIFFYLVFNICGQFKLIQDRLSNFNTAENDADIDTKEVERIVHSCIELHQDILLFCERLKNVSEIVLFAEIFMLPIFLCTAGYIAILFPDNFLFLMFSGVMVLTTVVYSLLHCVPATILTTESLNIANAAYESNWYTAPLHVQKQIMFIIARSQRPFYLTAAKITAVSVETFEAITRSAASYFTLFSTMRE